MFRTAYTIVLLLIAILAEGQIQQFNRLRRAERNVARLKKNFGKISRSFNPETDTSNLIVWQRDPYIPNSGMIRDYQHIYTFLHSSQEVEFNTKLDSADSIFYHEKENAYYKYGVDGYALREDKVVFGWHPYWMNEEHKYYNYDLLSFVSYYSYEINPYNGSYWNEEVIDSIQYGFLKSFDGHDTKPLLSVTSYGKEENHLFLNSSFARESFVENLEQILNYPKDSIRHFEGVDLYFEELAAADTSEFIKLVRELFNRLKLKDRVLILNVPYYNDNRLNYGRLINFVDYFNIIGYDFEGKQSSYPGSISPLRAKNKPNLSSAVNDLLMKGVPSEKIILSLPLYGVKWNIEDALLGANPRYEKDLMWADIVYPMSANDDDTTYYDPYSGSAFMIREEDDTTRIYWYENAESLEAKYDFIEGEGLAGVGFWALSYDRNDRQIWHNLARRFAKAPTELLAPEDIRTSGPYGIVLDIVEHKKVIGYSLLILAGFIALGFLLSLTDWRVRDHLFKAQSFRIVYAMLFMITAVGAIRVLPLDTQFNMFALIPCEIKVSPYWIFFWGLLMGGAGVFLINYLFTLYRKELT